MARRVENVTKVKREIVKTVEEDVTTYDVLGLTKAEMYAVGAALSNTDPQSGFEWSRVWSAMREVFNLSGRGAFLFNTEDDRVARIVVRKRATEVE